MKGRGGGVSPGGEDKGEQHEANLDGEYCRDTTKQVESNICRWTGQRPSTGCFKSKKVSSLTDEDNQQQTNGSQLNVGVTEGVTEGGVDDHEEDSAAHSTKGRFSPLQKLPHKTPTHLQKVKVKVCVNSYTTKAPIWWPWKGLPDQGSKAPPQSWRAERRWRRREQRTRNRAGRGERQIGSTNIINEPKHVLKEWEARWLFI